MKYDFTTIQERAGMDAVAVDCPPAQPKEGFDLIPMWIADMNFPAAPSIPEAIIERTKHTVYGYFNPRNEYYDADANSDEGSVAEVIIAKNRHGSTGNVKVGWIGRYTKFRSIATDMQEG